MLDFKLIQDLALLINPNRVKNLTTIKDIKSEGKKIVQFYEGLLSNKYSSDNEAAMDLFGKDETYPSYKRLRRRLFELLSNTSLFIEVSQAKFTDQAKAFHNCYRNFATANILIFHNAPEIGIYLLKLALEQSIKYELTHITTEILRVLKTQSLTMLHDTTEIRKWAKMSKVYEEKRYWEIIARELYENLLEGYSTGRVNTKDIDNDVETQFENLLRVSQQIDTTTFYYLTYNIGNVFYLSKNNVKKALEISQHAFQLLKNRKNASKGQMLQFAAVELSSYTHLKIFNSPEALRLMEFCRDSLREPGTTTWYKFCDLYVHHYIYAEEYSKAIDTYKEAASHPRFAFLPITLKETWRMYQGYFHLLHRLRAITDEQIKHVEPINVDMFEYDFKNLSSVKSGMNIPVLMLPIFFKTLDGEFEGHGRSKESLRKYVDRHLHKRKNVRSVTMIKLLVALDEYPYRPKPTKRLIAKLLETFKQMPIELSEQSAVIEIVPYERLWELILRYRRIYL